MKSSFWFASVIIAALVAYGCNAVKPHYNRKESAWHARNPEAPPGAAHRVFLTGELRLDPEASYPGILPALSKHVNSGDSRNSLLFLGNTLAEVPVTSSGDIDVGDTLYDRFFDEISSYPADLIFLQGNLDWDNGSGKALKELGKREAYLQRKLHHRVEVEAEIECPGPVVVDLTSRSILILINSQWWLQDWDRLPGLNEDCDVESREELMAELKEILVRNQDKSILIAMHHSLVSSGYRGGMFSYRDHLFPMTNLNPKLWIPLPLIGSFYPAFKKVNGTVQDHIHPKYRRFRKAMLEITAPYSNVAFVTAHDQNLQFHELDGKPHIISGSGTRKDYVRKMQEPGFAYAGLGYCMLSITESGEVWMEFFEGREDPGHISIFRKMILPAPITAEEKELQILEQFPGRAARVSVAANPDYQVGKFKQAIMGAHYREAWATPVLVRSVDFTEEKGGLVPVKKGGGFATRSYRLRNDKGHQYVIRTVDKDPSKSLPEFMRRTFVANVLKDQTSAAHPYGALVIPRLAAEAKIYYARPELVYVQPQPALKDYIRDFSEGLYLMEERPDGNMYGFDNFGNSTKVMGYGKAVKRMLSSTYHRADQEFVLRSRLFDMWVNDWDRHDDQWRWATFKAGDDIFYRPVPRDRDQVFYKFDGALPWLFSRKWVLSKSRFQSFEETTHNIVGLNFNARYFDRAFLTEMDWSKWEAIVAEFKRTISDQDIEEAVREWPSEIYALDGEEVIQKLKARRDHLDQIVRRYYEVLSRQVSVVGTDDREYFRVRRLPDGSVHVVVRRINGQGEGNDILYERVLLTGETREIRLYGLGGADRFKITGESRKGMRIRVIGGKGIDEIVDASNVSGWTRKTRIYDEKRGAVVNFGRESRSKLSNLENVNDYSRYDFKYDVGMPLMYFGYNPEDGIFLGLGVSYTKQGFRKEPYHSMHTAAGNFSLRTRGFNLKYASDFKSVIRKYDIHLDFTYFGINYVRKFYGIGNETENPDPGDREYNRVRMRQGTIRPSIKRTYGDAHAIKLGPFYQYANVDRTPDRFVSDASSGLIESDFEGKHYAGLFLEYEIGKVNSTVYPTRGIKFINELSWWGNLEQPDRNFTHFYSDLILYYGFNVPLQPVVAARAGFATNIGDYEFYQSNVLGGRDNLRGYSAERFSGTTAFFQNTELRLKIADVNTVVIPFTFGIFGLADHGRIWEPGEQSDKWHHGYGGGVWLSPLGMFMITGAYSVSEEDKRFNLHFRFQF